MKSRNKQRSLVGIWGAALWLILSAAVFAAVPQKINYQGYLTDPGGAPISDNLAMTFSIYNQASGGTALWFETRNVALVNGLYSVNLGEVTPITLAFGEDYYLGIAVGADAEMTPRQALTSTGYAFRAKEADHAANAAGVTITGGAAAGYVLTSDASGAGTWQAVGSGGIADGSVTTSKLADNAVTTAKIQDNQITEAKLAFNPATQDELDAHKSSGDHDGRYLLSTGGNLTGILNVSANSVNAALSVDNSGSGYGVRGYSCSGYGVYGYSSNGNGVYGLGNGTGVYGSSVLAGGYGVQGVNNNGGYGIYGASTNGTGVYGYNNGAGRAGYFQIASVGNGSDALYAVTSGSGNAGSFQISNAFSGAYALSAVTTGTGRAGFFQINNPGNGSDALYATTNGSGNAGNFNGRVNVSSMLTTNGFKLTDGTQGAGKVLTSDAWGNSTWQAASATDNTKVLKAGDSMTGALNITQSAISGMAGNFQINNANNGSPVFVAATSGLGQAGSFQINNSFSNSHALYVTTNGTGVGYGLYIYSTGLSRAGFFEINNPSNGGEAIIARTNGSGQAVHGYTTGTSNAGVFDINNASNSADALWGYTNGTGKAGYFQIANAGNNSDALYAVTNGGGPAVSGYTTGLGRAGFFRIDNANNTQPALYALTSGSGGAGLFSIDNVDSDGWALHATTNGIGRAGSFQINNTNSIQPALYAATNGTGEAVSGSTTGSGYSGYFSGGAGVYVSGNLNVTGSLSKGSGTFVQPHPTDAKKEVAYAFFEGPEHAVFLRGKAKLVNGKAAIQTPEYWRVVAGADEDITVQFTPRSAKSKGLAAVEVTKARINVEELMDGKESYEFDYFITAKRAGFEKHQPIQANTHFKADNMTKEEFERRYAKTDDMTIAAMRSLLISNGILTAEGKLNIEMAAKLGWKLKEGETVVLGK